MKHEPQYVEYVTARLPWLRRVAFLLCGDWYRADDLVQIAVTQLFVHWGKAQKADNLDGYARKTLVRVFLTERRRSWAVRTRLMEELPEASTITEEPDLAQRFTVRAALAGLPPRQRAAVVLRYYCDLSVEQTAEVMRCSTGNVKSQTARGLQALRQALEAVPNPGADHVLG